MRKFEETGSTSQYDQNIMNLSTHEERACRVPDLAVRKRARAFNVPQSSLHHIIRKYLCLHTYKMQIVQDADS